MTTAPEYAKLTVIRGSNSYKMTDYARLYGIMGAGMAPLHRIETRGPLQHGSTDRGFRLDPRQMRLLFYFTRAGGAFWDNRDSLISIFSPSDSPLILRFDLGNGARRQIKGHALPFGMNTDPGKPNYQTLAVDVVCNNPLFYDPTTKSKIFAGSFSGDTLQVPMSVNMFVGSSTLDLTKAINYAGSFRSYPFLIRISGMITDPKITNEATGEILDFTGTTIADGSYYDIDLRHSHKTVVDENDTNKIDDLTAESDIATWHLATEQEVSGGVNSIVVEGSSINSNTEILMQWYEYYLGI